MIKFHFDTDFDGAAQAMIVVDGQHYLFVLNPVHLAAQPCWVRELLANTLVSMALTPPPGLTADVIDLEEFRQWCEAMNTANARPESASV